MKRGGPLRRTGRLSPVSARRAERTDERAEVRAAVFARDRECLLARQWVHDPAVPRCFGDPRTPHHLLKASQGGGYTVDNLVTLCAGHNEWVERDRETARLYGLVIDRGE